MSGKVQTIEELDDAGNLIATYVQGNNGNRFDVIKPANGKSIWQKALDVFLPAGYPHSVTEDYMEYQIYDSLQAFSSSIAGLLASRAVLEGFGVGDASASPTAALLLSIFQESTGRVATILFAHRFGTALEPECKMYRLAADVFNDAAMILDCLSPALPKLPRVLLLSTSSMLRALCGVAAGSSKASLSAHFARWGNLGELNAKDSSQETVISLLGMLAGTVVVSRVSSQMATWTTLIFLLGIHLMTNWLAVRAVNMRSLNRQRTNLVISKLVASDKVLSPKDVAAQERTFERDGVFRWCGSGVIGRGIVGVTLKDILRCFERPHATTQSFTSAGKPLQGLLDLFEKENYMFWIDLRSMTSFMVLKEGASTIDTLKAWSSSLLAMKKISGSIDCATVISTEWTKETILQAVAQSNELFSHYSPSLEQAGWDLHVAALETGTSSRIRYNSDHKSKS